VSNNTITPEIETEAALYAEGTKYTKADILKAYREHHQPVHIQWFCEEVLGIGQREYRIAFVKEDGSFDVVQRLLAGNDAEANDYAEHAYAGQEWFVLDESGRNINGGDQ
jgi:hypothetical protein